MTHEEINKLKCGDEIVFAGILQTNGFRKGKFIKKINEYLVEINYEDHTEQNHIANIFNKNLLT